MQSSVSLTLSQKNGTIKPPDIRNIPEQLKAVNQWVAWKAVPGKNSKTDKIPYNPKNGHMAKANDPETWGTFDEAYNFYSANTDKFAGVGIELSADDLLCGIDLDNCFNNSGWPDEWACGIIDKLNSYTEISPSGKGIRIFVYGKLPPSGRKKGKFECYDSGRFLTVTGNHIKGTPLTIENRQKELEDIHANIFGKKEKANTKPFKGLSSETEDVLLIDDNNLINKAKNSKNGHVFEQLWAGNWNGHNSQSEADLALCNILAFWTARDRNRMDRLFRQSGLYREKWDKKHYSDGRTYGEATIQKAIEDTQEVYQPYKSSAQEDFKDNNSPWEPPKPLNSHKLPPYPIEVLPGWLRDYCQALATATQTPPDVAAQLALAVIGSGMAKKFAVRMREGWLEQVVLYVLVVLNSGERKSAVFSQIIEPLEDYEQKIVEIAAGLLAEAQSKKSIMESRLKAAQTKAAKAAPDEAETLEEEAGKLARELAAFELPVIPKLVVDDISTEQTASILAKQGGRLAVLSPEGGLFENMAGRYSNGVANFDVYLKGYSGDTLRIDRVGRAPEYVRKPALTVALTVQPEVLEGLFEKPGFRGRGLIPRFMFSLPDSLVGRRDTKPPPVPKNIKAEYKHNVTKILELNPGLKSNGEFDTNMLILSPGAERLSDAFAAWLEPQLADAEDLHLIRDWAGKLHGAIGRLAGILHIADNVKAGRDIWKREISEETFKAALTIGKYLIEHAKAAFLEMGTDEGVSNAKYLLRVMEKEGIEDLSRQELWQKTRGKFKTAEKMDSALNILIEHGYIRERQPDRKGPGRPKGPGYLVNPYFLRGEN